MMDSDQELSEVKNIAYSVYKTFIVNLYFVLVSIMFGST